MPFNIEEYLNSLPLSTTEINLSFKELTCLPDLSRFKQLTHLYCYKNQLTELPPLNDNLQLLDCSYNQLTKLSQLNENLTSLFCSFNELTELPRLNNELTILDCSFNKLTELPPLNNNLEYLKSTYPETFAKQQVVTEAKTGIKTLVDDVNPKSRKLTKDEIADYEEQIGRDAEEWLSEGTIDEAEKALKNSKAEEAYYRGQYLTGKLDPVAGEKTQSRMDFLRKKVEYAEDVKDRRLITVDEINELDELERVFEPRSSSSINISDPKTAEDFTNFARQNDPEGFKKIQKIADDINNKNTLKDFDIKDREPNAKGGSVGNLTYKKMFNDLDRTLNKGLGTMFKRKR